MTAEFETDRRRLIGGTLGALTIAAISGAAAAPASKALSTIRKALPPRGSFGIVLPGIKRTAFLNVPAGMNPAAFQDHWIATYAPGLRMRGAQAIIFNVIDKEHSPDNRFDAGTEMFFASDWAYEQEYFAGRPAYSEEAGHTIPAILIVSRPIAIRPFHPVHPTPPPKRFP